MYFFGENLHSCRNNWFQHSYWKEHHRLPEQILKCHSRGTQWVGCQKDNLMMWTLTLKWMNVWPVMAKLCDWDDNDKI